MQPRHVFEVRHIVLVTEIEHRAPLVVETARTKEDRVGIRRQHSLEAFANDKREVELYQLLQVPARPFLHAKDVLDGFEVEREAPLIDEDHAWQLRILAAHQIYVPDVLDELPD
jgi:hypothetical protein